MLMIPRYKYDRTVRFHAHQSILFSLAWFVTSFVLILIPLGMYGFFVRGLWSPAGMVTWLILMVQAYRNHPLILPWIGRWAMRQADRRRAPSNESQSP